MNHPSPKQAYVQAKQQLGFIDDPSQSPAIESLEQCFRALHTGNYAHCIYGGRWAAVKRG